MKLQKFEVGGPTDFDGAFAAMTEKRVNAVVISEHPLLITNAKAIADLATRNRILAVGYIEFFAAAGGTIGYGAWRSLSVRLFKNEVQRRCRRYDASAAQRTAEQATEVPVITRHQQVGFDINCGGEDRRVLERQTLRFRPFD